MKRVPQHKKTARAARQRRASGRNRKRFIRTTFSRTTPDSVEDGDFSETGWIDEEGDVIALDKYDRAEGLTLADKAVQWLRHAYATEPSSSHFHKGVWYSTGFNTTDYRTGEEEERSCHLYGFTEAEEREIFSEINRRAR
jgi:hypothetical protein